jgi:hypothetical protein
MTPEKVRLIASFLEGAAELDKKWSPGVVTLIVLVVGTAIYWTICGLILKYYYEPSDSDDEEVKSRIGKERNLNISIMLIVYFSLCIGLIVFYAWRIKKFQDVGWDLLHPGQSFGGSNPLLTWGLMSLFAVGGLFISIALIFYYAEHSLPTGVYVCLGLLSIFISSAVSLVGKVWINCDQSTQIFTSKEKSCVEDILKEYREASLAQAKSLAAQAQAAGLRASRLQKATDLELASEAVSSLQAEKAQVAATSQPAPASTGDHRAALANAAAVIAQAASRT